MNDIDLIQAAIIDFPPDDEAELLRQFLVLLQGRTIQETVLLRRCYLDNQPDAVVAMESGLSAETVARLRAELKSAHYTRHYLVQPPHAAD